MQHGPPGPHEATPPDGAAFRGAVPRRSLRTPVVVGLAGFAVLAVALLTREASPPPVVPATASPTPLASAALAVPTEPAATRAPSPRPTLSPPERDPDARPFPTFAPQPVAAGATVLLPGAPSVRLTIDLPAGWARASDAMVVKAGGAPPAGLSIGAWSLEAVETFPCRGSSPVVADPVLMRAAEGQAVALSSWWGQDAGRPPNSNVRIAPVATRPQPTAIAGYPAWYLEMLVLSGFDFGDCDAGQLVFWRTPTGEVRYGLGPGELHRLWVVDVDGEVIVIDAASFPSTSAADPAELQGVIDSLRIDR